MFKFTQALLVLQLLIALSTHLCFADIQNSEADVGSDVVKFPNFVQDSRSEHVDQLEEPELPENGRRRQRKVAFFVGLFNHFGPVYHLREIAFDNIVTNIGSGYSGRTGRFTVPVHGVYQFSINVAARPGAQAAVTMLKNGLNVMIVWSDSRPNWAPASNVAILPLRAGDRVSLQVGHNPSYFYGRMYTTFSGFLIYRY